MEIMDCKEYMKLLKNQNTFGDGTLYDSFKKYTILSNAKDLDNEIFNIEFKHLINDTKIFKFDKELTGLLLNTKNKINFERNLPFDYIFLEINLMYEDLALQGLWLSKEFLEYNVAKSINECDWRRISKDIIARAYITNLKKRKWVSVSFKAFKGDNFCDGKNHIFSNEEVKELIKNKNLKKFIKTIQMFLSNFLDFLNHPDVETRVIKWGTNEARIKRGQLPIPDKVKIDIKGKLYKYIYEDYPKQKIEHNSPKYSFEVRGHYKHFWNKKKWNKIYILDNEKLKEKSYQIDNKGIISKWILPYIKGVGLLINKKYNLKI